MSKEIDRVIELSRELGEHIETMQSGIADVMELLMEYNESLQDVINEP